MTSPFEGLTNAVLLFQSVNAIAGTNSTGNPILNATVNATTAFLRLDSKRPKGEIPEGLLAPADAFKGYVVSSYPELSDDSTPMILPPDILPLSQAVAKIGRDWGVFVLDAGLINPDYGRDLGIGALLEEAAGTKITGWFKRQRPPATVSQDVLIWAENLLMVE